MTGITCMVAGLKSFVRDPATGEYYDANNRVTYTSYTGPSPPSSSYTQVVFRWAGTNVYDSGQLPYPAVPPSSVTVGSYTYYAGTVQSSTGGDPSTQLNAIYRFGP